jgi:hypothetical protein
MILSMNSIFQVSVERNLIFERAHSSFQKFRKKY